MELTVEYLKALQGRLAQKQDKEIKPEGGLHDYKFVVATNLLAMKPFITTSYRYLKNYLWHVSTLTFLVITPYLLEGWPFAFTLRA